MQPNFLSLADLYDLLSSAESDDILKEILLDKTPGVLELASPEEFQRFYAFALAYSRAGNGKSVFDNVSKELSGAERKIMFNQAVEADPIFGFITDKDGNWKFEGALPRLVCNPRKLAKLLLDPFSTLRALPLENALVEARNAIASHLVKLSNGLGQGGILIKEPVSHPFPGVMTEADFITPYTATFIGSAALQKQWRALLPLVRYQNREKRIFEHFRDNVELRREVQLKLEHENVSGAADAVWSDPSDKFSSLSQEVQVFAGDIPLEAQDPPVTRLAVLTPFSLFFEAKRAKESLQESYKEDYAERVTQLEAELTKLEESLVALKNAKPSTKDKQARLSWTKQQESYKHQIKRLKDDLQKLSKKALNIRSADLLYGGSQPQNMAQNLGTWIHNANVRVNVPFYRRSEADIAGSRIYHASSLIKTIRTEKATRLPWYFRPNELTAKAKKLRRVEYYELLTQAIEPLVTLRETYSRSLSSDQVDALRQREILRIEESTEAWRAAVLPLERQYDQRAAIERLASSAAKAVGAALRDKYSDAGWPETYAQELLPCIKDYLVKEIC